MCGIDEELWLSIATHWRITMACTRCRAIETHCLQWDIHIEGTKEVFWWWAIHTCTQEVKKNQNEDEDNYRCLWQGEWNHLLMFALCKIVSCFERQLLLHALLSSKHINAIVAMVSQSISWVVMHLAPHGQCSKWIPKSLMVWSHWHFEKCATIWCGILKQIQSAI
jgi:hypothetical protein